MRWDETQSQHTDKWMQEWTHHPLLRHFSLSSLVIALRFVAPMWGWSGVMISCLPCCPFTTLQNWLLGLGAVASFVVAASLVWPKIVDSVLEPCNKASCAYNQHTIHFRDDDIPSARSPYFNCWNCAYIDVYAALPDQDAMGGRFNYGKYGGRD